MVNINFFGLLHRAPGTHMSANVSASEDENFQNYLKCAATLSKSLSAFDLNFTLLTNDESYVNNLLKKFELKLDVKGIHFDFKIKPGTKFFSAHHKIDTFRFFGEQKNSYSVLIDLDCICLGNPLPVISVFSALQIPIVYDISEQIYPSTSRETVAQSIALVCREKSEGRWYGGEFIGGNSDFFSILFSAATSLNERYQNNLHKLHHIGDEMLVNSALTMLRSNGQLVADAGPVELISRYWNTALVKHEQRSWSAMARCAFLHLPSDKGQLAGLSNQTVISRKIFMDSYVHRSDPRVPILKRLERSIRHRIKGDKI